MNGNTHALAGICLGLLMAQTGQPWGGIGLAVCGGVGALLPDIDHPKSMVGRRAGIAGGALRLVVGHRGILHSGVAAAIMIVAALMVPTEWRGYALAGAVGYASHLALDGLTVQGIPLLWPSRRRFRLLRLTTGGVVEWLLRLALLGGLAYLIFT